MDGETLIEWYENKTVSSGSSGGIILDYVSYNGVSYVHLSPYKLNS